MLIAALLCLSAALAMAALGGWLLARRPSDDISRLGPPLARGVLRGVAPTQLAAAVMLAAGGAVALAAPPQTGLLVVIVCAVGAVGTVATGCWQAAKVVSRGGRNTTAGACGGACATCTLSCS